MTFYDGVVSLCGGLWLVFDTFTFSLFYVLITFDNSKKTLNYPNSPHVRPLKQFSIISFVAGYPNKNPKKYQNSPQEVRS